jgi:myo-inositol 2-dehydrogenase / D-chiro-inositol 1-dehydrogenase
MKKVNLAIIGTGRMGSVHVKNVVRSIPEINLVAICDIRLDVARAVADDLGIERVVKDYHELLADKNIDAVLIATSTDTHAMIVKDAALAGKQIFCEKPLAPNLKDIRDMLAVVKKASVKLQVGFNRRFDKSYRKVHEIVASNEMGRPCVLNITNRDPEFPSMDFLRVSGGIFLDLVIHDFDMIRYQLGDVEEIYAIGAALVKPEIAEFGDLDNDIVTLKFKNGAIGVINNSRHAIYGYDQRLEVFCANGTIIADNEEEHTVIKGVAGGYMTPPPPYFFMQRYAPCYVEEVRQFAECVRDDKPTPTTGEDGYQASALGFAAWKSFHENRPVKLSEVTGE